MPPASQPGGRDAGAGRSSRWVWPVVVLAFCQAVAVASTQVLNILVDPIRADLQISDTQYSLLQGLAFAVVAGLAGLPAARLADAGRRRLVILLGVAGWSLATLACAWIQGFGQLFAARVFVGLGEVFLFPAAVAMIADLAPRHRLGPAMAIFGAGGPLGAAAALAGGGWLLAQPPESAWAGLAPDGDLWRLAFLACAALGIVAALLLLTLRDEGPAPERGASGSRPAVVPHVLGNRGAYLGVSTGLLSLSLAVFATSAWAPTFLMRVHGLSPLEAGQLTGFAALACATTGIALTGLLLSRLEARGRPDAVLLVSMGVAVGVIVFPLGAALAPGLAASALLLCLSYAMLGAPTVLGGVALQQLAAPHVRAQVVAIYVLLVNSLPLGLGPAAVALLTDRAFKTPSSVGHAIAVTDAAAGLVCILALLLGRRAFVAGRLRAAAEVLP